MHRPDFEIPWRQWRPLSGQPFIDISSQASRAAKYLEQLKPLDANALQLVEVSIQRFYPFEAVKARKGNVSANLDHWLVAFRFCYNDKTTGYSVYTLLNNEIFAAGESDSSTRRLLFKGSHFPGARTSVVESLHKACEPVIRAGKAIVVRDADEAVAARRHFGGCDLR